MENTKIHPEIHSKFKVGLRWAFFGGLIYESCKIIHCLLLLKVLEPQTYGIMGSLFAIIYLTTYIADIGATNSITPFFQTASQSRQVLKRFLINYTLIPHLTIAIACSVGAALFISNKFITTPKSLLFIAPLLIIFETIRSFLRVFLHTTFQAKNTVTVEIIIFFLYIASIWTPYLILKSTITLNHIFIPHLIDSMLSVLCFIFLINSYKNKLPNDQSKALPEQFIKRLASTRLFNYLLRVSRNLFTSNFLTPLFAIKFGLAHAGIFYFASMLANGIQAIVKSVVGYSGGALLANLKDTTQDTKREAFTILSQKFVAILAPILIFLVINYKGILALAAAHNATTQALALSLLFLIISFSEFFFVLYEQFYVIEEASHKLFLFKILELSIFYGVITSPLSSSPIVTLLGLILIRMLGLCIIAVNAFYLWKIKPNFKVNIYYLCSIAIISLFISLWWR